MAEEECKEVFPFNSSTEKILSGKKRSSYVYVYIII